ncbi:MAG: V-type ATP synthase subunit D [Candidatus Omnitrophica bacterium]|nr:V-type ATP synthase subunit D [Candidatus Omnitrophota bacterium]
MERVSPTRINLLLKKQEIKQLISGIELLRHKKDVLLKEFFSAIGPLSSLYQQLEIASKKALFSLVLSLGFLGKEKILSYGFSPERELEVDLQERNLWGVRVPELKEEVNIKKLEFGKMGTSVYLEDTQEKFAEFLKVSLRVLPEEIKIKRLGKEIKSISRKVNYLEKYVLPALLFQVKYIQESLNEYESQDIFRLKRIKKKKIA